MESSTIARMNRLMRQYPNTCISLLGGASGMIVTWGGNSFGFWWITVLVGLLIGFFLRRSWLRTEIIFLAAVGGWGLDLLWQARSTNIAGAASVVAAIFGLGATNGYLVIVLTLAFAWILCLVGSWVGVAARQMIMTFRAEQTEHTLHPNGVVNQVIDIGHPASTVQGDTVTHGTDKS
jgi:hypothetical protein